MDKKRKAFWFSLLLTGAGQFYLGEKKKGWLFLIFSLLGLLISCVGIVLVIDILLGFIVIPHYKIFFSLGIFFSIIGLALIIISGYRSIKDITSSKGK
jgi:TM2 domain-containing membrane protein YozV